MPEAIDVVAAHLIDGDQHDELRLDRGGGRGGPRRLRVRRDRGQQQQRSNEGGDLFHDRRIESYNQPVSKRRLILRRRVARRTDRRPRPAAQTPSLDEVLKRSASYVAEFRKQLSGIVAEETYRQEIVNTGRIGNAHARQPAAHAASRICCWSSRRTPIATWSCATCSRWTAQPVRDRQARLESAAARSVGAADGASATIIAESARYNIGSISETSTRR